MIGSKFAQIALGNRPETFEKSRGDSRPETQTQETIATPWSELVPYLIGSPGSPEVVPQALTEPEQYIGGGAWDSGDAMGGDGDAAALQRINPKWEEWNRLSRGGTVPAFTPGQAAQPRSPGLYPEALRWYQSDAPEYFPGDTRAPVDPMQLQAQQMGLGATDYAIAQGMGQHGAGQSLQDMFMQQLEQGAGTQNPAIQRQLQTLEERGLRNFDENIAPRIRRGSMMAGQDFGGSREDLTRSKALARTQEIISQEQGDLLASDYANQSRNLAAMFGLAPSTLSYAGTAGNIPGLLGQRAGQVGGIGQFQRAEEQAAIDADIRRHQFEQNLPLDKLQNYAALLGQIGVPGSSNVSITSQGQKQGGGGSSLGNAIGGGLMGYGAMTGTGALAGTGFASGLGAAAGPVGLIGGALLSSLLS